MWIVLFFQGVISVGSGSENQDEYHSVIYYHEDRPRWMETFKVQDLLSDVCFLCKLLLLLYFFKNLFLSMEFGL